MNIVSRAAEKRAFADLKAWRYRSIAKKRGLPYYFSGRPCIHGHRSMRITSNNACLKCLKSHQSRWSENNREKARSQQSHYRTKHREKIRERGRQRYAANRESINARRRKKRIMYRELLNKQAHQYRTENKERINQQQRIYGYRHRQKRSLAARVLRELGIDFPRAAIALRVLRDLHIEL